MPEQPDPEFDPVALELGATVVGACVGIALTLVGAGIAWDLGYLCTEPVLLVCGTAAVGAAVGLGIGRVVWGRGP